MRNITITVNGKNVSATVEPRTSLGDFLRTHLHLTGTHFGCEHGVCGACTVLINGVPARSCIAFVVALDGADVRTVEGFEDDDVMTAVRTAFHEEHALQCGFCTSGMLVTARDIATRFPQADEQRIRRELAGNLCRCTGYVGIVNAVQRVLREMPPEARLGKTRASPQPATPTRALYVAFAATAAPTPRTTLNATIPSAEPTSKKGWSELTDSFVVERPRKEAWQLFADVPRMAACMPGMRLAQSDSRDFNGNMYVSFGPIRAAFSISGTNERDDSKYGGVLEASGSDAKSGSRVKGQVVYRLLDIQNGDRTRVEVAIHWQLQGPLAQFGRSGLVKDFASRLVSDFARNLSDELSGKRRSTESENLHVSALIWSIVTSRLRRLVHWFTRWF